MNFPDIIADTETFDLEANSLSFRSPYNNATQTANLQGDRWTLTATYSNRTGLDARLLKSFIRGLRGQAGRFNYLPADWEPYGNPSGTPLVNGSGQLSNTLETDGWTPSTRIFEAGDYFSVNGEFKEITAPIDSNGSGEATLEFTPPLRKSPADGATIVVDEPRIQMKLTSDNAPINTTAPIIYALTISAEEAIDI